MTASPDLEVRAYPFGPVDGLQIHPVYAYLREHEPLSRIRMPYGEDAWLVVRHADIRLVRGDARFGRAMAAQHDEPRMTAEVTGGGRITDQDPPEHTRLRRLIAKAFTARRTELLRPRAQQVADELLDRMLAQGPPADLVDVFALTLPGILICEMLGVPPNDRAEFREWANAFMSLTALSAAKKADYMGKLAAYVAGLVAARRDQPTDDILGDLVRARDEHDRLSESELITLALTLFVAGFETTASEIASFCYVLTRHPDQLDLLRKQRDLVPSAVEELLRYVPLSDDLSLPRYPSEDVELSGGTVPAGEPVFVHTASANRDPAVFDDPEELDLARSPNPHLAFGHGAHHCVGAQLARVELQVALGALVQRLPGLRLAVDEDQLQWKSGMAIRGPVTLPIAW